MHCVPGVLATVNLLHFALFVTKQILCFITFVLSHCADASRYRIGLRRLHCTTVYCLNSVVVSGVSRDSSAFARQNIVSRCPLSAPLVHFAIHNIIITFETNSPPGRPFRTPHSKFLLTYFILVSIYHGL